MKSRKEKQTEIANNPDAKVIENKPRKKKPVLWVLDGLILIMAVIGIGLIVQPMIVHWQQDRASQHLIENFEEGDGTIVFDPDELVVEGEDVEYFNEMEETEAPPSNPVNNITEESSGSAGNESPSKTPTPAPDKVVVKAIGRIKIPKIKVDMPVAEGATKYNLRVAAGHYTPSAGLGQEGLTVLFGHRMYTHGRHFNRLGEVQIGDLIIIEDEQYRYTYTVDRIDRVKPEDLFDRLYDPGEGCRIMLVTCDPVRVASHRLLVYGTLTKTEPKE